MVRRVGRPRRSTKLRKPLELVTPETSGGVEDGAGTEEEGLVEAHPVPETLFDELPPVAAQQITALPPIEAELTPDQRAEFIKLLDTKMGLEERADRLVLLAKLHGAKTAPVGLRAIMEINRLTRLSEDRATEAPSMFQLPEGTSVSVRIEKVDK